MHEYPNTYVLYYYHYYKDFLTIKRVDEFELMNKSGLINPYKLNLYKKCYALSKEHVTRQFYGTAPLITSLKQFNPDQFEVFSL